MTAGDITSLRHKVNKINFDLCQNLELYRKVDKTSNIITNFLQKDFPLLNCQKILRLKGLM